MKDVRIRQLNNYLLIQIEILKVKARKLFDNFFKPNRNGI